MEKKPKISLKILREIILPCILFKNRCKLISWKICSKTFMRVKSRNFYTVHKTLHKELTDHDTFLENNTQKHQRTLT